MHSPLIIAWGTHGSQMSGTCRRFCKGCLQRSKPKRERWPQWRRNRRRSRGGLLLVEVRPMGAKLFAGQSSQEEERELPTSEKAWGKARTAELPPPEMDV